jgi:hypothetical protein
MEIWMGMEVMGREILRKGWDNLDTYILVTCGMGQTENSGSKRHLSHTNYSKW